MSKLSDRRTRKDRFHQRARKEGYVARAVFKLQEIDEKVGLLRPGQQVLDLGCAPGSWLQYAAKRVGREGALVGIDRFEIDFSAPNLRTLTGDIMSIEPSEFLGELEALRPGTSAEGGSGQAFDVVLSDMAPDTTGIRHVDQARSEALFERALEIAEACLAPGGHFVGKLFQGPSFQNLLKRCRTGFAKVKVVKPASSRTESIEQYVVAREFKGQP